MTGTILILVSTSLALGLGVAVGRRLERHSSKNLFVADVEEADELRAEAAASVAARTERRLARILKKAKQQTSITNDDVEDMFCISDRTARNYLNRLVAQSQLTRVGAGRGTHYVLPQRN